MTIAYGQPSIGNDTAKVWIPRQDALRKLAQADSLKTYKIIVSQKQKDLDTLLKRIDFLQEIIREEKAKDSLNVLVVATYERQLQIDKDARKVLEDEISVYNKEIRKLKTKIKLTALAGIVTTGAALYLGTLIHK